MVMTRRSPLEPSSSAWFYGAVVLCLAVVVPGPAAGYGSGAPTTACESMLPEHGSLPQEGTDGLNVAITTNVTLNNPIRGTTVFVSLTAETTDDLFKGFFIQARHVGGTTPLGRFFSSTDTPDGQQVVDCQLRRRTAVTHSDARDKMIVTMLWYYRGTISDVVFVATIVKSQDTFWVNVTSDVLFPTTTTTPSGKGNQNVTQTTTSTTTKETTTQEEVTETQTALFTDVTTSGNSLSTTNSPFTTDGTTTSSSLQTTETEQTPTSTPGAYTTSDFTTLETTQDITTDEAAVSSTTSSLVFTSSPNVSNTSDTNVTTPPMTSAASSSTVNLTTPSRPGSNVTTASSLSTMGNVTTLFPSNNASATPFTPTRNVTASTKSTPLTSEPNMTTILITPNMTTVPITPVVTAPSTLQTTFGTPSPNTSLASTTESPTSQNQTEVNGTTEFPSTDNSTLNTTQTEVMTTSIMTTILASNDTTTMTDSMNVTNTSETTNVTSSPTPAITTITPSTVSNVTLQSTSEPANVTNHTETTNVTTQVPVVTTANASSLPPSTAQTTSERVNATSSWRTTNMTSTPVPVTITSAPSTVPNVTVRSTRAQTTPSPSTRFSTTRTSTTVSSTQPMTTNITRVEGPSTLSRPITTEQPITQAADEVFIRFRIMNEEYTSDLTIPSSSKYRRLEDQVVTVMEDVYIDEPSLENITVLKFSPGSVIPDVKLVFSSSLNESDKVAVVQVLYDEAEDGQLGSFSVDQVSSLDENGLYQEVDDCYLNPCPSNVNCSSDRCSYPCSSNPGYCRNGGQCTDLTSDDLSRTFANCTCDENHEGLRCDTVIKMPSEPNNMNSDLLIIVLASVCGVLFVLFAALLIAVVLWCKRYGSAKSRTIDEDPVEVAKMQFLAEMRGRYHVRSNMEDSPGNGSLTSVNQFATTSFNRNPEAVLPRNFVAIGDVDTSSGSLFYITDSDSESDHFRPKIFDAGVTFPHFSQMMGSIPDLLGPVADYEMDVMQRPAAGGTDLPPNKPLQQRSVSFSDIQQVITDDDHIGFENFTFGNQSGAQADNSNFQVRWDFQIGGNESPVGEKSDSDDANGGKEVEDEGGGSRETSA